jgi:hypothetical protein
MSLGFRKSSASRTDIGSNVFRRCGDALAYGFLPPIATSTAIILDQEIRGHGQPTGRGADHMAETPILRDGACAAISLTSQSRCVVAAEVTLSVITLKPASVHGPNEVTIATSVAVERRLGRAGMAIAKGDAIVDIIADRLHQRPPLPNLAEKGPRRIRQARRARAPSRCGRYAACCGEHRTCTSDRPDRLRTKH